MFVGEGADEGGDEGGDDEGEEDEARAGGGPGEGGLHEEGEDGVEGGGEGGLHEAAPEGGEEAAGGEEGEDGGKGRGFACERGVFGGCGDWLGCSGGERRGGVRRLRGWRRSARFRVGLPGTEVSLRDFLLDEQEPQQDIHRDDPKGQVIHLIVARAGVDDAAQQGRKQVREAHGDEDGAHDLADLLLADGVDEEGEADGPDDGGGEALQQAAEDEDGDGGADAEHYCGAGEAEEADEEGEAPRGGFVGEEAADC